MLSMLPGPPKHHSFIRLSRCSLCKPVTVESQLVDLSIFTFSPFTSSNSWHVPSFWVTAILLPLSIPSALLSLGGQGLLRPRLNIACPEKPFLTISTLCKFMALCSCPSLIELLAHVFFLLGFVDEGQRACLVFTRHLTHKRGSITAEQEQPLGNTERREAPSSPPGSQKLQTMPSRRRPYRRHFDLCLCTRLH